MTIVICYAVLIAAHLVRLAFDVAPNYHRLQALETMIALATAMAYAGLMGVYLYGK